MPNIEITHNDVGEIELDGGIFRDELLYFAEADTFAKGTILARQVVALAVVASAVSGGGNGTVTAATVVDGPVVPLVGVYTLRCMTAVANGGVWQLEDPNGAVVATGLTMAPGALAATVLEAAGLRFTITDGGTDFSAGASATLTVAAAGQLVPFNPAGAGGAQVPTAILTYAVTKASSGNVPIRALVAGEVNATRLVIDAGGSVTTTILDQLRGVGIVGTAVKQLAKRDNDNT